MANGSLGNTPFERLMNLLLSFVAIFLASFNKVVIFLAIGFLIIITFLFLFFSGIVGI